MISPVARIVWGVLALVLVSSCVTLAPLVKRDPATPLTAFELVYFKFGDAWATHHTMTEVLGQEFERRGFVVLLKEPAPDLWPRTLQLRLDLVEDARTRGKEQSDRVGRLGFRLEQMIDAKELGHVVYKGIELDRIGQRDLAEEIVDQLLKAS